MKELCVVHLVRAVNGIEPFRRFLDSYLKHPAGMEHDLLMVFKGFDGTEGTAPYRELLETLRYEALEVSDEGLDITAYFAAAEHYGQAYRTFCFLNSYSVILAADWLGKLHVNLCKPGVGLVGATGSWVSHRTNALEHLRNPAAYIRSLRSCGANGGAGYKAKRWWALTASVIEWIGHLPFYMLCFDPFPNYFIRTNAFMISTELLKTLDYPPVKTKLDAYRFEGGKQGLTKTILAMGQRVLVVGKDGKGYEKEMWNESRTLFSGEQENLLVADNRTADYQHATPRRRRYLSLKTWH